MAGKSAQSIALEKIDGWDTLEQREVEIVVNATQLAREARRQERQSKMQFGKQLQIVREILEPRRLWMAYLKAAFHMSAATGYRYIKYYEVTEQKLPKQVLTVALNMGYDIPISVLETTRPPKTDDHETIVRYLERVTLIRPRATSIERSTDDIVKEWLHAVVLGWPKLPPNPRTRANVIRNYIGMLMTQFGIGNEQTFAPVAIPDNFRVIRGRPRLDRDAAA